MKRLDVPANITLMDLNPTRLAALKPVRVLDIFDGGTTNFHEDGLFSTAIFGRVGSDERDTRFSFIDLRTNILHPLIYNHLVKLKGLYSGIMSGKAYAVWSEEENDFLPSDQINGKTGYHFFMQNWKKIQFKPTGSDIRDKRIELIEKYKKVAETRYVLVMPAGLRDIQIDEAGRTKEGEINTFYRTLIAISNSVSANSASESSIMDTSRHSMQTAFNNVFAFIENLIEGKGGFIQKKWGARNIFNGTRNVISAMDTSAPRLGAPNSPKSNNTALGLYQLAKSMLPKTKHLLLNGWLKNVFGNAEAGVNLVNPITLKRENVKLSADITDRWYTTNGLDKIINSFQEPSLRLKPIKIEDYYLGLVYRGHSDKNFRIFGDIDELPPNLSRDDVHPLTLCELIYCSGYQYWNKQALYLTRYPVATIGSIYPSFPYVKTTVKGEMRWELNEQWERVDERIIALEYPTFDNPVFVDTLIPHPSRLVLLGADFDGDMSSCNIGYADETIEEVEKKLQQASTYLDADGGLLASACVETVERVLRVMTGP